jgi:hypothetical protein
MPQLEGLAQPRRELCHETAQAGIEFGTQALVFRIRSVVSQPFWYKIFPLFADRFV